jgi:hypothetical protein
MTSTTQSHFDAARGEQLKFDGMAMAAANNQHVLKLARSVAKEVALGRASGTATSDDVGKILALRYEIPGMGPAAGSLFKTKEWEWTGDFVKSTRVSNHSRLIRVWRLK